MLARLPLLIVAATLISCFVPPAAAQPMPPAAKGREKPQVAPGTIVEIVARDGQTKLAAFVEFTFVGHVVVKLEDGTQETVFPNKVRLAKDPKKFKPKPAVVAGASSNPLAGQRLWSDATGKFKIEAQFVAVAAEQVELKKADGKTVKIPLAKLSPADADIARALASGAPENPFQTADEAAGSAAPALAKPVPRMAAGDEGTAETILLGQPGEYRVPVLPATIAPTKITDKGIAIPGPKSGEGFFESVKEKVLFDAAHNHMLVAIAEGSPGAVESQMRIERLDVGTGKAAPGWVIPDAAEVFDIDPSGTRLLTRPGRRTEAYENLLDVWQVDGAKLTHVQRLRPYSAAWPSGKVYWASLVNPAHLLTCNDDGRVVLWKLPEMQAIWKFEGGWWVGHAFNADRTLLAILSGGVVSLLEPLTGEVLGQLEQDRISQLSSSMAFHPDGKQLMVAASSGVKIFDLETGKSQSSIPVSAPRASAALGWPSERFLLVGDTVVDTKLNINLCHYSAGHRSPTIFHRGHLWCVLENRVGRNRQMGMVHFPVPHPDAMKVAEGLQEEDLLAIKPGDTVGLQLNLPFSSEENERIRQRLIKNIGDNGWIYASDGAAVMLSADIQTGETTTTNYRSFRGETASVSVTPQYGNLRLKRGEAGLWHNAVTWSAPGSISLKEGQSVQDAVNVRPTPDFFLNTLVPRRIIAYPKGNAFLSAEITAQGIRTQ